VQCVVESAGVIVPSSVVPCPGWFIFEPGEAQAVVGQITADSLASIGVTPETLSASFGLGFGWVTLVAALGFAVKVAVAVIRKG